jgi:hypothetical protein
MTIQFNCPNCDALIAFQDKHAGKRARCLTCGQIFIIPSVSNQKPEKIKSPPEVTEPQPGFYRALILDSWKIFFRTENAVPLVFVVAVVCFKFFLSPVVCCGWVAYFVVWGWLFGFYLNIIYESAFGIDKLPEIYLGTSITFLWYIIKPFLVFSLTMLAVQLPFFIGLSMTQDKGITFENLWHANTGLHPTWCPILLRTLFVLGLFLFPMAILTTAVGQDITFLRPDYIIMPILKAPLPYAAAVALLVAASLLETCTTQYEPASTAVVVGRLAMNLAVQPIAIIAMRSIGLFYRHYCCYFKW